MTTPYTLYTPGTRPAETPTEILRNAPRRIIDSIHGGYFQSAMIYVLEAKEAYKTLESETGV